MEWYSGEQMGQEVTGWGLDLCASVCDKKMYK